MTGMTMADEVLPGVPQIVAAIEDEILSGRWPERTKLPSERTLAERFAVSRPVVRESLRVLTERGLIVVFAGRGSFVRGVHAGSAAANPELLARRGAVTAEHLVVARTMLECEAAALAAINRTEAQLNHMRELLERFETAGLPDAADLDLAFHECISVASKNPVIQVMFGSIKTLTHGIMLRSLTDRLVAAAAVPLHSVILGAIADQDPDRARVAMADHLGAARTFYGDDLDQPLIDVLRRRAELTPGLAALLNDTGTVRP